MNLQTRATAEATKSSLPHVVFLANDAMFDQGVAFLESFRRHNPALPLSMIPFADDIGKLERISRIYDFNILQVNVQRWDALAADFFPSSQQKYRNRLRKLAVFDIKSPATIYLDLDIVVLHDLSFLSTKIIDGSADIICTGINNDPWVYNETYKTHTKLKDSKRFSDGFFVFNPSKIDSDRAYETITRNKELYLSVRAPNVYCQPVTNFIANMLDLNVKEVYLLFREISPQNWYAGKIVEESGQVLSHDGRQVLFVHWAGPVDFTRDFPMKKLFEQYRTEGLSRIENAKRTKERPIYKNHALSSKPWGRFAVPSEIFFPRGLLGEEERRMLYYLTAKYYSGIGCVVDAGSLIGASAFCLALGLEHSAAGLSPQANVYSYDLFKTTESYVAEFVSKHFPSVSAEDGYRRIFDYQTALVKHRLVVYEGDFISAPADFDRIEILFIDVAKTVKLNQRIVEHYFPKLIPKKSIVIQQDFYHPWHPYIHITMEYLREYFDILDPLVPSGSRVYLMTRAIPDTEIQRVGEFKFSFVEQMELLDSAASHDTGATKMMIQVAQIRQSMVNGRKELAQTYAEKLREAPEFREDSYYARELIRILQQ